MLGSPANWCKACIHTCICFSQLPQQFLARETGATLAARTNVFWWLREMVAMLWVANNTKQENAGISHAILHRPKDLHDPGS
jgi:hypothetical protein